MSEFSVRARDADLSRVQITTEASKTASTNLVRTEFRLRKLYRILEGADLLKDSAFGPNVYERANLAIAVIEHNVRFSQQGG